MALESTHVSQALDAATFPTHTRARPRPCQAKPSQGMCGTAWHSLRGVLVPYHLCLMLEACFPKTYIGLACQILCACTTRPRAKGSSGYFIPPKE